MNYNSEKYCNAVCQKLYEPDGLCDTCHYYDFNGDEQGAYTGAGFCNLFKQGSDPYSGCEDFICRNVIASH